MTVQLTSSDQERVTTYGFFSVLVEEGCKSQNSKSKAVALVGLTHPQINQ